MDPHIQPNPNPKDPRIQPPPVPLEYQAPPVPATQPALPAVRFPSAPYAPDGAGPVGGFFALLGLTMLAGAVIGAIAGLIHLAFYLVLIFPILMGFALGGAALGAVVLGKVRNRLVAALAGVLGGCVCILAMHFISYLFVLNKSGGSFSFGQYIDAAARAGVTISSSRGGGRDDKPMNLGYTGSFIYWFLELAIVAGIAAAVPAVRAGQPFCEECDSWKTQHKLGVLFLGRDAATDYLESGELWRLADPREPPGEGPITLTVWWCPHCLEAAPVDAQLDLTVQKKKGVKVSKLGFRTFPGEALPVFRALCDRRGDPNIPPAVR
jgi:hypothetical protein